MELLIVNIVYFIILLFNLYLLIKLIIKGKKGTMNIRRINNDQVSFCVLINYGKDLKETINSLKNQTIKINMKDIYIINNQSNDKLDSVVKENKTNLFISSSFIENSNGYDECIKHILADNKKYDIYFILNGNDILDKDYLKQMIASYQEGYDVITSRRIINTNEGINNHSLVALNELINLGNINSNKNKIVPTFYNTGYLIKGSLIEKWKGFPFTNKFLAYELKLYLSLYDLRTSYNENAIIYSNIKANYKELKSLKRNMYHSYFEIRKKYKSLLKNIKHDKRNNYGSKYIEVIGPSSHLITAISFALIKLSMLVLLIIYLINGSNYFIYPLIELGAIIIGYYLIVFIISFSALSQLDLKNRFKATLYLPFFIIKLLV